MVISTLALVIFYTICGHFNKHSVRSFSCKKIENWEIEKKTLVGDLFYSMHHKRFLMLDDFSH